MTSLSLRSFATLVQQSAAAVQGRCATLLNFTPGSVLRALLEANAGIALWMQYIALQILQTTRLATSGGADVDSFVADFGLARQAAVAAAGGVTLARFTATAPALVAPWFNADGSTNSAGATVRTGDGTLTYGVAVDATNALWTAARGGYLIPAGTASATVPVQCLAAGSAGNVAAGAISLLGSAVAGVDTVANALAFTTGADAETDAALQARFANYIQTRARATRAAVLYAATSVQAGLTAAVLENQNVDGSANMGHFIVVVDDGTGTPSATLQATVYSAVDAVRPVGSTFQVKGPAIAGVSINVTVATAVGASHGAVVGEVNAALTAYVNALGVGAPLYFSQLIRVAYAADSAITNVSLTLNGTAADVTPAAGSSVRIGTLTVA